MIEKRLKDETSKHLLLRVELLHLSIKKHIYTTNGSNNKNGMNLYLPIAIKIQFENNEGSSLSKMR